MRTLRQGVVALGLFAILAAVATPGRADEEPSADDPGAVSAPGPVNRIMGTGEMRAPEVFTREQRLLHAVRTNDRGTVQRALELGVSVHARDDLGRSALLLAVHEAGSLELVRLLHARGARLDEPDASARTPLSFAAGHGHLDIARYLVAHGAAPDAADKQGRTPLFHAALNDHAELIAFLHQHGARIDVRARHDETPLISACARDMAAAAARLLELGADPGLRDRWGRRARDRAAPETAVCQGGAPR